MHLAVQIQQRFARARDRLCGKAAFIPPHQCIHAPGGARAIALCARRNSRRQRLSPINVHCWCTRYADVHARQAVLELQPAGTSAPFAIAVGNSIKTRKES